MRFLYTAISYPDVSINKSLYAYLILELANQGHEVRVVAPCFDGKTHVVIEGGIPVLRVKSGRIFKTNLVTKGINTILLNRRYTHAIQTFWPDWKMDWILASTPPITLSPLLKKLKKMFQTGIFLILRDIFPQNAKDLGMIRDPFLFAYFRKQERHLYKISDVIGCMSPGNMNFLRKQDQTLFSENSKITYFPNWIQPSPESNCKEENQVSFRQRFNLEEKFIVLFGGNFGKPQKMEFIIELAEKVQHLDDVIFLLIGDGTEKKRIQHQVHQRSMKNVKIYERLPREEYQSLIGEADIGLVNLSEKFTIPNIPSRTLGYWDAGLPILAATDIRTDLNDNFLKKYNAGLWAETGDIETYYSSFMKLYQDKSLRKIMGDNGRRAVETDFSVKRAVDRLLVQIKARTKEGSL